MSLSVDGLHVQLANKQVLKGIDFTVDLGERIAIVGPNGCGKSTLLRTISGILKPDAGDVKLDGKSLSSYPRRIRARKLGFLGQSDVAPMMTTVREHVGIGRHPHRRLFRQSLVEDEQAIHEAIQLCEVEHLIDRPVERLSGGERQRVRIATLFAQSPSMMLLDEPFTGLDIEHQYALLHLLAFMHEQGRLIMVVLHDLSTAMRFFDRVLVIQDGRLVADGPPLEVMTPDILHSVFRIEASIGHDPDSGQPLVICHGQIPKGSESASEGI
ncbi:MAG: hypothetical protein CMJ40_04030 [Phycisphaerae bacterium]|nr:hypothetical protein [Phycisphaerae bacterium]|tara:strand:- start:1727 stop:2536 length:810 start_codon:yes stop_codon:yes gene_type:complete